MRVQKRGLLVVSVVLLILLFVTPLASAESCLVYPNNNEELYCVDPVEAESLCAETPGCDLEQHTLSLDCAEVEQCQLTYCYIDCDLHPKGFCEEELNSRALDAQEEAIVCQPGCCIIEANNQCNFKRRKFQCDQTALGYGILPEDTNYDISITTANDCAQVCGIEIEEPEEEPEPGAAVLTGQVTDGRLPLSQATVVYQGRREGSVFTDETGNYRITAAPGDYTIIASKIGYRARQETIQLLAEEPQEQDFILSSTVQQGIRGITSLDEDGRIIPRFGVNIYLDGVFKGRSRYPDSSFEIFAEPGEYNLTASYQEYASPRKTTTIQSQQMIRENLLLTRVIGECSAEGDTPQKNVEEFNLYHVPGESAVRLQWMKPCAQVIGYTITRSQEGQESVPFSASPIQTTFVDLDVEWGETYTYDIVANYQSGLHSETPFQQTITLGDRFCEGRFHENTNWETFCLVDDQLTSAQENKQVYTCNNENQIVGAGINCADRDGGGEVYFCAKVSEFNAECKDAGACAIQGVPFGLYHSREQCYGHTPEDFGASNFCYYEYTDTIVNQCQRCDQVQSCFAYRSKDSCEVNNCLDKDCAWIDAAANDLLIDYSLLIPELVSPETGSGYCVEENYEEDDQCQSCSPSAGLWENYFCTADVCSALGRCFSNPAYKEPGPLTSCESCGESSSTTANCYTYNTDIECTGGQGLQKNDRQELTLSKDQCEWERCIWQGESNGPGTCVKDGDGDTLDDCAQFTSGGEISACRVDVTPPSTKIVPEGLHIVSLTSPNITFNSIDTQSPLRSVGFCLTSSLQDICTSFTEQNFLGTLTDETTQVDIIEFLNLSSLENNLINGETYRIKFYGKDKYFNQERVKEAFIYVDNVPPFFEIAETYETIADITSLTVYLEGLSEPASCQFSLTPTLPRGQQQIMTIPRETQDKTAEFENLQGARFDLEVKCTDDQGNIEVKEKTLVFDLEENIEVISPADAITEKVVTFQVETLIGATCTLFVENNDQFTFVADFQTDEQGREHQTQAIDLSVRYPDDFHHVTDYRVSCRDFITAELYEEQLDFTIDTTAPGTQIILSEGEREVQPQGNDWRRFFRESASTSFSCASEFGFSCSSYHYCITTADSTCRDLPYEQYEEFTSAFSITNSSNVCYYAKDEAGNIPYLVTCGIVELNGDGIILVNPEHYHFQDVITGVSKEPVFNLEFFTQVPTEECRFDFSSGFSYETVPAFKTIMPNPASGNYIVENFPESAGASAYGENGGSKAIFVRCQDAQQTISEEQKINLEFDPTSPNIESAEARPNPLAEGVKTTIFVETDDKSTCKFDADGATAYEEMQFSFPGQEDNTLHRVHQTDFAVSFIGLKKDYLLNVMCKNGASDLSELEVIEFTVDYTLKGNIVSIYPNGESLRDSELTVQVETSKNALCEIEQEDTFQALTGAGSREHSFQFTGLTEGEYNIPIRCRMADHVVEQVVTFTIDRTAPVLRNIEDGKYSCGAEQLTVIPQSNDSNIASYEYKVVDIGTSLSHSTSTSTRSSFRRRTYGGTSSNNTNASSSLSSQSGTTLITATVSSELPIHIPTENLTEGRFVRIDIRATDAAGNVGQFVSSDGVQITSKNLTACKEDGVSGRVTVLIDEESCTESSVELRCEDSTGCQRMNYGKQEQGVCEPIRPYTQRIPFTSTGTLCYYVEDNVGNNGTGQQRIVFPDIDGDEVRDSCDRCPTTESGRVVDEKGCSSSESPPTASLIDTDSDGLPDYWEQIYNTFGCELDHTKADSDSDGVTDTREDYDEDEFSNYEEYTRDQNPCEADEALPDETDDEPDDGAVFPDLPEPEEESNLLPLILFLLGFVLTIGGIGYLIYFYHSKPAHAQVRRSMPVQRTTAQQVSVPKAKSSFLASWKKGFQQFRKSREQKHRTRQRKAIFSSFNKSSQEIPHVKELLSKKASHLPRLHELAQRYNDDKKYIKPGLRKEEHPIFKKLESIAQKTKDKKINQVITKKQAKDIFSRLRDLSKQRKK